MEGVERSALAWECKLSRLKSEYSKFRARKSKSGASGESTLKRKPPFFEEMYELECSNARNDPPAVSDSGQDVVQVDNEEREQTSSRKRARKAQVQVLGDYADTQKERFEREITVMEKWDDTRQKLADALIAYLQHQ